MPPRWHKDSAARPPLLCALTILRGLRVKGKTTRAQRQLKKTYLYFFILRQGTKLPHLSLSFKMVRAAQVGRYAA